MSLLQRTKNVTQVFHTYGTNFVSKKRSHQTRGGGVDKPGRCTRGRLQVSKSVQTKVKTCCGRLSSMTNQCDKFRVKASSGGGGGVGGARRSHPGPDPKRFRTNGGKKQLVLPWCGVRICHGSRNCQRMLTAIEGSRFRQELNFQQKEAHAS